MKYPLYEYFFNYIGFCNIGESVSALAPIVAYSLTEAWEAMKPRPVGILDQLVGLSLEFH